MGTTYFSPSFLISSLFKYLNKCEVQKGAQCGIKDQRARPAPRGFHDMSCLDRAHQLPYQRLRITSEAKEFHGLVCSEVGVGVLN